MSNPLKSYAAYSAKSEPLLALLTQRFGEQLIEPRLELGDVVVGIDRRLFLDFVKNLKHDSELRFNMLIDVTVVDWLDNHSERFEVVYHLMSLSNLYRLRIKVSLPEAEPSIASLVELYPGANFMEREAWDMYGVVFKGHPELRRLLMYDEFKGHPLRKDYPIQQKQPRVPLRAPEVHNTARDMLRPGLVQIGKRATPQPTAEKRGL